MGNSYLSYISDKHLLECIKVLHNSYLKARENITKTKFYNNKVDAIKLTFDAKFNSIDEETLIKTEVLRQIDKSFNNSIGTFHENILGGIEGFEVGNLSGFDIKAVDNSLFAIFKFDEISKNIEDCVFEKLTKEARFYKNAKLYLVDFTITENMYEKWVLGGNESYVSHKNVFKISGNSFYDLVTQKVGSLDSIKKIFPVLLSENFN